MLWSSRFIQNDYFLLDALIDVVNIVHFRSSHQRCSVKKDVLKNFVIFTGKHLYWNLFLEFQACNFIKKRLQHRCFPVKIAKFWRTYILKNICEWLLLTFPNVAMVKDPVCPPQKMKTLKWLVWVFYFVRMR